MKEPLSAGWVKERYGYHEALLIVGYWRHDGPHPGADAKLNPVVRRNAADDIRPLLRPGEAPAAPPAPRMSRTNWVNAWRLDAPKYERAPCIPAPPPAWVAFEDLAALCPGVFGEAHLDNAAVSYANGPRIARIREVAEALGIDPFRRTHRYRARIEAECLKDHKLFTKDTFGHAWKALKKLGK